MKRVVSMLLVLALLVPCMGMAEQTSENARKYVMRWSATPEGLQTYLDNGGFEGSGVEMLASAASALLNTLTLELVSDGEACFLAALLQDTEAMNIFVDVQEGGYFATSIFPNIAFPLDTNAEWRLAREITQTRLQQLDWVAMKNEAQKRLEAFADAHEEMLERGLFDGDAYTGCDMYRALYFDDQALTTLTDEMLTAFAPLVQLLEMCGMDVCEWFRERNEEAARLNATEYELILSYREEQLMGIDFLVVQNQQGLVMISVGIPYEGDPWHDEGEWEILVTLPMPEWLVEHHILLCAQEEDNQRSLSILSREYHTLQWFSVEEMENGNGTLDKRFVFNGLLTTQEDGSWAVEKEDQLTDFFYGIVQSKAKLNYDAGTNGLLGEAHVYSGINHEEAWQWQLSSEEAAMPEMTYDMVVDLENMSEAEENALQQDTKDFALKLLQLLPPELLVLLLYL